jgi:galactose mutarotase-like enzyme
MNTHILENEYLRIEASTFGAELQSIKDKSTGFEYLWHGDKEYWARRSPILFPIVGKVWEGRMIYQGKEYPLSQHGFARDCMFDAINVLDLNQKFNCRFSSFTAMAFLFSSNVDTRKIYPFDFDLYVVYQLEGRSLKVHWIVDNKTDGDIYFQIGAHPAFNYRDFDAEASIQGYMKFDHSGYLSLTRLECGGYAAAERTDLLVPESGIPITKETFAGDALVFENQLNRVALCDKQGETYVELFFDAPVVGLWSPAKTGYAPFMCIEPWYGRCDDSNFSSDYSKKSYINHLNKGECFQASYLMTFYALH